MTYDVISTGSKNGNCLILNNILALDIGVTAKAVSPYIKTLRLVFCGHEHGDHFKRSTIRKLAQERPGLRFCGGPWMAEKFLDAGVQARNIDVLEPGRAYNYGAFQIEPVPLHHDVPNYGLKIYMGGEKIFYAVDTGFIDDVEAQDYQYYFLEANHHTADIEARAAEKLAKGEFAYEMRAAATHLSYEQAMDWLYKNMGPASQYVLLHQHTDTEKRIDNA